MIFVLIVLLKTIQFYSYLIFAYALLSWFPGAYETWLGRLLVQIVDPVIRPFRRFNLQFMGLDFTIWAVIIALNVLSRILIMIFT
jgi:YggT family protein